MNLKKYVFILFGIMQLFFWSETQASATMLEPVLAQPTYGINYQAVVRDAVGKPIINTTADIVFRIVDPIGTTTIYTENQPGVAINAQGLISAVIGSVTQTIDPAWFTTQGLELEIDITPSGGSMISTSQTLASIPYALNAVNATNAWSINGNAGTDAATNFIGTSDAQDVVFQSNASAVATFTQTGDANFSNNIKVNGTATLLQIAGSPTLDAQYTNGTASFTQIAGSPTFDALYSIGTSTFTSIETGTLTVSFVKGMPTFDAFTSPSVTLSYISGTPTLINAYATGTLTTATLATTSFYMPGGTAGQQFTSDANGYGYWLTPTSGPVDWAVNGNAVTSSTSFIGTTTAFPLNFKVNSIPYGSLSPGTNLGVGSYALNSLTTASYNTAFGQQALATNMAEHSNTAIGYTSMKVLNNGMFNVGVGSGVMSSMTAGSFNAAVGHNTLGSITNASGNSAFGYGAMSGGSSGNHNTALGYSVLIGNTGDWNVGVGRDALLLQTTGFNNTGIGSEALKQNTTGSNNVALGYKANVSTGALEYATAIGAEALVATSSAVVLGPANTNFKVGIGTTSPSKNLTVIGTSSFTSVSTFDNNLNVSGTASLVNTKTTGSFILPSTASFYNSGATAGQFLVSDANGYATFQSVASSGWSLTGNAGTTPGTNFIGTTDAKEFVVKTNGAQMLKIGIPTNSNFVLGTNSNPSFGGSYNFSYGDFSMLGNASGSHNFSLGYNTLSDLSTGSNNIAIGQGAARGFNGSNNIALGQDAMRHTGLVSAGNYNVGLGSNSLFNTDGDFNIGLGYSAGSVNTTGTNNIFIGRDAQPSTGALNYATAIGYGAVVATSSAVVLGPANTNFKVGIGTSIPSKNFTVVGSSSFVGDQFISGTATAEIYTATTGTFTNFKAGSTASLTNIYVSGTSSFVGTPTIANLFLAGSPTIVGSASFVGTPTFNDIVVTGLSTFTNAYLAATPTLFNADNQGTATFVDQKTTGTASFTDINVSGTPTFADLFLTGSPTIVGSASFVGTPTFSDIVVTGLSTFTNVYLAATPTLFNADNQGTATFVDQKTTGTASFTDINVTGTPTFANLFLTGSPTIVGTASFVGDVKISGTASMAMQVLDINSMAGNSFDITGKSLIDITSLSGSIAFTGTPVEGQVVTLVYSGVDVIIGTTIYTIAGYDINAAPHSTQKFKSATLIYIGGTWVVTSLYSKN